MPRLVPFAVLLFLSVCASGQSSYAPDERPSSQVRPALGPRNEATPKELEMQGDLFRADKNYVDAIDHYRAALRKGADSAVLHNKIGFSLLHLTRYGEARKEFEKAIKRDPRFSDAINNLGAVYFFEHNYKKAIRHYEEALKIREDSPLFHLNLGMAYFGRKDFGKASQHFTRAFELDPEIFERRSGNAVSASMAPEDRARYCFELSRMYARAGNLDRSFFYLRRALEEGYKGLDKVRESDDFANLRKDPRFADLLAQPPPALN